MSEYFYTVHFREGSEVKNVTMGILEHGAPAAFGRDYLSRDEKAIYSRFKVDSRRNQFLAGRYIVKQTVRQEHPDVPLGAINIVHGIWGFPLVHSDALSQTTVSIGHADSCAAALFFNSNTHPVGIDVEEMTEKNLSALKKFITGREQELIRSANLHFPEVMHLLWSAKEAAGKALKVGFTIPEELYTISSIAVSNNIYSIGFEKLPMLTVAGWRHGNHVVCIAFPTVWCLLEMKRRTAL